MRNMPIIGLREVPTLSARLAPYRDVQYLRFADTIVLHYRYLMAYVNLDVRLRLYH